MGSSIFCQCLVLLEVSFLLANERQDMWPDLERTLEILHTSVLEILANFQPSKKVMADICLICIFTLKFSNGLLYLLTQSSYYADYYTTILVITCVFKRKTVKNKIFKTKKEVE
jgi:hypothetical protein